MRGTKGGPFPGRETTGHNCSITPNGNIYDRGEQSPFSNGGFNPRGDLGTGATSQPFLGNGTVRQNRTGEGSGFWNHVVKRR